MLQPEKYNPSKELKLTSISDNDVTYTANAGAGYLHLKGLNFSPGKAYVLELKAEYSSQSLVQLFFSDATQEGGYPYSNFRWLKQKTYPSDMALYFHLNFENLGSSLRIHPTLNQEDVTIKFIKLREVDGDLIAVSELSPASP